LSLSSSLFCDRSRTYLISIYSTFFPHRSSSISNWTIFLLPHLFCYEDSVNLYKHKYHHYYHHQTLALSLASPSWPRKLHKIYCET
jgi:hypothetical protein